MDSSRGTFTLHPVAGLFPRMSEDELASLVADIEQHGVKQPILVYHGQILDGRHRWEACQQLEIECPSVEWDGDGSAVDVVVSLNLKRRHLTQSQAAAVAVDALPQYEAEARERQGTRTDLSAEVRGSSGKAADHAAKQFHVAPRYVEDAKAIRDRAPERFAAIKRGEVTVSQVKREMRKIEHQARPAVAGKFRVLYADPPWKYSSSSPGLDYYGPAERHYEALSIEELCDLTFDDGRCVAELSEPHSVLFLWVTAPMLEDSFRVIRAWGFQYKTSFVWDKVGHNFGHYSSVRHELLLVCTRGSCTPEMDALKLPDSVVEYERDGKHSEKPEVFRKIIDTLYPKGERIELFARRGADGWETWGSTT